MSVPQYDEIHVISDLHMGGKEGFQILKRTGRMADYIGWVAKRRPDDQVALVLNGDVIDTLAEEDVGYIALTGAAEVVQRIMDYQAFAPIWDSLATFVRTENRNLVIVLGNHDLEMSFPAVQDAVIARLATTDAERGRIKFSTMGAGFACLVGGKKIFCTHGNETDSWNLARYEDLAKAARRINCNRKFAGGEWQPNAGTKMVKDVMNHVKHQYPWIDLLKPEDKAAVGVLIAIDPSQLRRIKDVLSAVEEFVEGSFEVDKRLSADSASVRTTVQQRLQLDDLLGPHLKEAVIHAGGGRPDVDELMKMAEDGYADFNPEAETDEQTLGWVQLFFDKLTKIFTGISDEEALRKALCDWLDGDETFDPEKGDEADKKMQESVGPDIDFFITGHTHLQRGISLGGGRYYFNCGTWIRLLQFTDEMLANETSFAPVYKLLKNCTYKEIDEAEFDGQPFVLDRCGAVWIKEENGRVGGGLYNVKADGAGKVRLEAIVEIL